jgi:hypothetical protein
MNRRQFLRTLPAASVLPLSTAQAKKTDESLEELLMWAQIHDMFIIIFRDGFTKASFSLAGPWWKGSTVVNGGTLREALLRAKAEWDKQQEPI